MVRHGNANRETNIHIKELSPTERERHSKIRDVVAERTCCRMLLLERW